MNNTFINNFDNIQKYKRTENNGIAYNKIDSAVYQMFAQCGAFRNRSDEDCILLFKNAFEEDESLAIKCLFWARDVRGGDGERRFFRVCFNWLAKEHPEAARRNMRFLPEYGRIDDLYCLDGTPLEHEMYDYLAELANQAKESLKNGIFEKDLTYEIIKWLKSENCSSKESRRLGTKTRLAFGMTSKQYRKFLSWGRKETEVLETILSANKWNDVQFNKLPSKAGLKYKEAFLNHPETADRYKEFAADKKTKVNAGTLYPYEIVAKVTQDYRHKLYPTDREMINKYWENLPDYLEGKPCKMLCMVDTSGSMTWRYGAAVPINVAISLGMYCAERVGGDFNGRYISFSREPHLIKIEGADFVDKVRKIYDKNLCENTDLVKAFELVRLMSLNAKPEDIPDTIVVISDMEIDEAEGGWNTDENKVLTEMEAERKKWLDCGLQMPRLVYWCVEARHDTFLDMSDDVSYVSGFSPTLFKQILTGKTGIQLMEETLLAPRYEQVR